MRPTIIILCIVAAIAIGLSIYVYRKKQVTPKELTQGEANILAMGIYVGGRGIAMPSKEVAASMTAARKRLTESGYLYNAETGQAVKRADCPNC